jgi:hypothetical protein
MSHWTKSKVKIKKLYLLKKACEDMGVEFHEGTTDLTTVAGTKTVEGVISCGQRGGEAGIVKEKDGTYSIMMDNWRNPLVSKCGPNCDLLMQRYTTEVAKAEARALGGMVASQRVQEDGWLRLEIQVA